MATSEALPVRQQTYRALLGALAITTAFLLAEAIGALLTNSLALLADAGHMLSDVIALGLSVVAVRMAMRPPTATRTFGLYRLEVLAALGNGLGLLLVSGFVFYEAAHRFGNPPHVSSLGMTSVAFAGLLANLAAGWLLYEQRHAGLNARGAFLHVAGDTLGSVGAVAAGLVMLASGWFYADPLISVIIGALIVAGAWRLVSESVGVLLEAVPGHIETEEVERALRGVAGVEDVHDLHIWTVTSGFVALSCHCRLRPEIDTDRALSRICSLLHDRFHVQHVTVQPERGRVHDDSHNGDLPRCVSDALGPGFSTSLTRSEGAGGS